MKIKHFMYRQKLSQNIRLPNLGKFNYFAKNRLIEILLLNFGKMLR